MGSAEDASERWIESQARVKRDATTRRASCDSTLRAPRAGNFRNICAAASDVICIRPRPSTHTHTRPFTRILHTPHHLRPFPPARLTCGCLHSLVFQYLFHRFSLAFPSFFLSHTFLAGSEFLCNLSACCTSCLTMLHLWFYYIAALDLWLSRLFATCDRNLQPAAAAAFAAAATDLWAPKTNRKLRLKTTLCK